MQMQFKLPKEIVDHIFELTGYHKFRKGKYIKQIDKNKPIFNMLSNIPLLKDWHVSLPVKTEWIRHRRSFCDKIIKIYVVNITDEYDDEFDNDHFLTVYDCGWYEYDFDGSSHKIKNEQVIYC